MRVPDLVWDDDGRVVNYVLEMGCGLGDHPPDIPHLFTNHRGQLIVWRHNPQDTP